MNCWLSLTDSQKYIIIINHIRSCQSFTSCSDFKEDRLWCITNIPTSKLLLINFGCSNRYKRVIVNELNFLSLTTSMTFPLVYNFWRSRITCLNLLISLRNCQQRTVATPFKRICRLFRELSLKNWIFFQNIPRNE